MDACTTAQGTLNDMLTYDKIESGMLQMEKQVIPIFQFVASELKSFSIQARYKNIDLMWDRKDSVHPSLEHLTILGDRHKISQAFRNILSNALKFTPRDGKVSVKVRVMRLAPIATKKSRDSGILRAVVNSIPIPNFSRRIYSGSTDDFNETDISHLALDANMAERDEMYCRIEVHDTGTQLVQSHLSNLFTKSGDFDPTDLSQGGSNFLSLWLTKNIIELHGGRVGASSGGVELFGSIFYVDLPLNFDETDLDLERNGMVANGTGTGVGFCSGGGEACCSNAVGDGSKDSIGLNGNYAGSDASGETGGRPSAQLRTITRDDLWKQHEELERLKNTVLVQAMLTTTKAAADQAASKNTKNKIVPISTPTTTFAVGATMSDKTDLVLPDTGTASAGEEIPLPACESVDNEAAIGDSSVVSVDLAPLININSDCLHVLIVDDMAMNRKILCKALGQLDCHVICTEAVDGTEAVEIMANSIPSHPYFSAMNTNGHSPRQNNSSGIYYDIILIDSHMVTLNGPEAALKIRQDCKYSGFIYGVTGDMSGADEFKAMGADDVFPKPLRFDTLKDIIYGKAFVFICFYFLFEFLIYLNYSLNSHCYILLQIIGANCLINCS